MRSDFERNHQLMEAVRLLRMGTSLLAVFGIIATLGLAAASGVRFDPTGLASQSLIFAAALVISSWLFDRPRAHRVADVLGSLGRVSLVGVLGGLISLIGLRFHLPMADGALVTADRYLGISGMAIVDSLTRMPHWVLAILRVSYSATVPYLLVSILLLAAMGERLEAWRAAFCFSGALLTTCLISIVTPAKGIFMFATAPALAGLPPVAGRYFWGTFDTFYSGTDPVLRLASLDGVVSFPSFHAVMALLVVAMWWQRPLLRHLACGWCALVMISTLPWGGHYVVDLIAGAAVWGVWFSVSRRLEAAGFKDRRAPASNLNCSAAA